MDEIVKPAALKQGDCIGVMAPGSYIDPDNFKLGCFALESAGFHIAPHDQCHKKHGQSAGRSRDKVKALEELFLDEQIDAIILAAGGNRTLHFLNNLDFNVMSHNPKIIMGYSDCTALLWAIFAQTGLVGIHGPTVSWFGKSEGELTGRTDQIEQCVKLLKGDLDFMDMTGAQIVKQGSASGPLIGGNLSLVMHLLSTCWCPDLNGAVLYLEDTGDELSWLDRDLWYLRETGVLEKISGLILGGFSLGDNGRPFEFTFSDILEEHTKGLDIPVVINAPFGHGKHLHPLPVGTTGRFQAGAGKVSLDFDSPVIK